ncbi:hypothetical protein C2857_000034 [Epichloe festucae Fl1]|uniref:Uncharacterized protein n=1 Tax=Epichloe festucae (strain Fl1) TaxID=877507 RepID=A0A7S9KR59_EPIFF|nr:hypothetical protein C2857_000034 [Epichloe festucae Fl1]
MATRQERKEAQRKHLEQLQKEHPKVDWKDMAAGMQRNIDFEFDVKDTLGDDIWQKMDDAVQSVSSKTSSSDAQASLAEARGYLKGYKELEDRFDALFTGVGRDTVVLADDISAQARV